MDFSREYIKMCQKATELRKKWKPKIGDWVKWYNKIIILNFKSSIDSYFHFVDKDGYSGVITVEDMMRKEAVPLWTQDQLQRRVKDRWSSWTGLLEEFGEYVKSRRWLDYTPEMYWLHFVMEKKFNKTWNEKKQKWEVTKKRELK